MSAMSNYLENKLIDATLRGIAYTPPSTLYLALFTTDPGEAATGSEVVGASYARKTVTFKAPVDGVTKNTSDVFFNVAAENWGTIRYIAVFDALIAGNMLYYGALDIPKTIEISDQFKIPQDYLTITLK